MKFPCYFSTRSLLMGYLLLLFLSCGDPAGKSKLKVFRYNDDVGISSLDPAFATTQANIWAVSQLFNGLVQLDDSLRIKPCIAHSWEISQNGLDYIFHLRSDIYFHDDPLFPLGKGRKVTAHDFVYSFYRIIDPSVASRGAWIFNNKVLSAAVTDSLKKHGKPAGVAFEAPDDSTLLLHLVKSHPPFLGMLSVPYCFVVPREITAHYKQDFRNHPVGTGPFKFKMWDEEVRLMFVKNETYFETAPDGSRLPYIDGVSISFMKNLQTAFMEFVQGKLDFFTSLEGSFKDDLLTRSGKLRKKYENRFTLMINPFLNTEYLVFLVDTNLNIVKNHPLRIKEVRQALSYAIDRKKLITYLKNNIGIPAEAGFVPVGLPSFDYSKVKGYSYDPDKSRQLLAKAGFGPGNPLPPLTLYTVAKYLDMCVFIQGQLAEAGIKSTIEVNQPSAQKEMVAKSQLNFSRGSWIADYPDPENYLALFYSKNFSPGGPNYTHYSNPEFDKLYEISLAETNDSLRSILYQQMDNIVMEDAPVLVLFYDQSLRLVQNNIEGLENNPMNMLLLKNVRIK